MEILYTEILLKLGIFGIVVGTNAHKLCWWSKVGVGPDRKTHRELLRIVKDPMSGQFL